MINVLTVLLLLVSCLLSQNNPNLYTSLSSKLYDANSKFKAFKNYETLGEEIQAYNTKSILLHKQGLYLESKADLSSDERNEYLASLRKLENQYIYIIRLLQQMLLNSINQNDYDTYIRVVNSGLADLWESHTVENQVIIFYQNNKHKGAINALEQLIHDKKLEHAAAQAQTQDGSGVYMMKRTVKKSGAYIDQENIPVGSQGGLEVTGNQTVAQSFTITQRGRLSAIDLIDIRHHRCMPSKSLYVSLVNMENGKLGPYSYYTRELHPNEISLTTKLFFGNRGPIVKPGEQYAIHLKTNAEPGGCTYGWGGDYETYNGGKTFINEMENKRDMKFRTYVLIN